MCLDFTLKLPTIFCFNCYLPNTNVLHRVSKMCPTMVGNLLMTQGKWKLSLVFVWYPSARKSSCTEKHLKVIDSNEEHPWTNKDCHSFPIAVLMIWMRQVKYNIKPKLPAVTESLKNEILLDLLGNSRQDGTVDYHSIAAFDVKCERCYEKCSLNTCFKSFLRYFKKYKEDFLHFSVTKAVLKASGVWGDPSRFYNNSLESLNNL